MNPQTQLPPSVIHDLKSIRSELASIPEDRWITHRLWDEKGNRCALGHLMELDGTASTGIGNRCNLLSDCDATNNLIFANNGEHPQYPQTHPQTRTLAYLTDFIEGKAIQRHFPIIRRGVRP